MLTARNGGRMQWVPLSLTILAALVAGCGGGKGQAEVGSPLDALRTEIRQRVVEPSREEEMLAAVDEMDEALQQLSQLLADKRPAVEEMFRDYDSSRDDFEALFADFLEQRRGLWQQFLDAHLRFKGLTTAEEWKPLAREEAEAVLRAAARHLGEGRS